MEYTKIPKQGVYRHMYCDDKHCKCDRIHLVIFSRCQNETIFYGRLCMECWLRNERLKAMTELNLKYENPSIWDSMDIPTWNALMTFGADPD